MIDRLIDNFVSFHELVYHRRYKSCRLEAKLEIFEYIEVFYNRLRAAFSTRISA